ncbi:hypothetical protein HELRODRAFT_115114 [Helobdella robusta]|uniref:MAU2 chromatid cohesion factor homolog n=1 Tax=Helobdella robusta TaxID=6412 RepID=T1EG67_HELRO|nr:hypothetical protein HELRODRAFT_115114 [Helobdella robusta]ESN94822.1 hypothetical protein HELRODRAFT_115114 [Helobdella robusta]
MSNNSNNLVVNYDESQQLGSWYPSLLGLAEYFRTLNPPNVKFCVQCLQAVFNFSPPAFIQARTYLQIGTVLSKGTKNIQLSLSHLDRAWTISQTCHSADDIKFEAACLSAQLLCQQGQLMEAKNFLRRATEQSLHAPFWHSRMLFQLAQLEMEENDHKASTLTLSAGFEYATLRESQYMRLLFLLSKTMVQLIDRKLSEVQQSLSQCRVIIEQWQLAGNQIHVKNLIEVFFLVIQVSQYLLVGQVKSVKPMLKQLQHTIQNITTTYNDEEIMKTLNPIELFHWLPKEQLCVLVYLVTVMHSMQAGYTDKAQKYTEKALLQIDKLKSSANPTVLSLQAMLLEHIVMCGLITGHKSVALQQILQLCMVCHSNSTVSKRHSPYIHVLLGLYAMSINSMEQAEAQFKVALVSPDPELHMFVSLNMGLVYLRMNRHIELNALLESIEAGRINTVSQCMKASTFYIQGLQAFFQSKHQEAKRCLREALRLANTEDLNRLTACLLVLFGHVLLSIGNNQEALNMISPALQLANKIPDLQVQLWATAVLKDLYRQLGSPQLEADSFRLHDSYSQTLLEDHFRATQSAEHQLVHWTEGPCPFFAPQNS